MDAKRFVAGFISSLLLLGGVRAQEPPIAASIAPPPVLPADPAPGPVTLSVPQAVPQVGPGGYDVPGISNWIRRETAPCCNGPVGGNSEIGQELYFRGGPTFPIGNDRLMSRNTTTGFTVGGGAQTLFYNHEFTKAWIIDTGLSEFYNSGVRNGDNISVNALRPGVVGFQDFTVSVRNVRRTFVNLGVGREWFSNPAKDTPVRWRLGIDGGGRYGTMSVRLNELTHKTDVIGGAYAGAHVLCEFACWHSIINVGVRTEYSYTWSDIFQRASDFSEVNLMFNLGVRY